ncbi:exodeoxyribonuclease VII small subunit [Parachlamydia sp. AcF125]|uniref:exodeoxyribonuclease VII small subunit n=1 Tax=Parachlamydia sp. AcF125 TaxID=2795736 RepID=UPI001BC9F6FE|nr:Exodeoxyribonuclease 7 small subunit [Parachlamydia sp. AcF125]
MEKEIKSDNQEKNFEAAFARLEEILEKMNSGAVSLDESLLLYEEADRLITSCAKRLNDAERRIEILIKNRQGDLSLDPQQNPKVQNFSDLGNSHSTTKLMSP